MRVLAAQASLLAAPGFFCALGRMSYCIFGKGLEMTKNPDVAYDKKWFAKGYEKGRRFANQEADYDDLAAICRDRGIPINWDIFRAEILNTYWGEKSFVFGAYEAGFTRACIEFFEKI